MDENEKKEPETAQEPPKPEDYSRYMGTLNRIYRRNNNPQRKKLGDGITSLKKGQQPAAPAVFHSTALAYVAYTNYALHKGRRREIACYAVQFIG